MKPELYAGPGSG